MIIDATCKILCIIFFTNVPQNSLQNLFQGSPSVASLRFPSFHSCSKICFPFKDNLGFRKNENRKEPNAMLFFFLKTSKKCQSKYSKQMSGIPRFSSNSCTRALISFDYTRSILLCIPLVERLLECTLLSTDIQAGLKRSYQNFVSASLTISTQKDFFVIRIASVELTRNPYALSLCSRPSHDTQVHSVALTLHCERSKENVCQRMHSKFILTWLTRYPMATQPVLEIFKMVAFVVS